MSIIDWVIVVAYLIAMLVIGFFAQGKIQTMDDFILGGKRFGKIALIGTIVATMVGSGMTMGAVGTAYNSGSTGTVGWMYFGFATGLIVMGLIAPKIRETGARSLAEMIYIKYGKAPRLAMALVVTFYAIAMVSINIAGIRTVAMSCFNLDESKLVLVTVIAAVVAIVYTSVGGLYAVVWTDVAQFAIMFVGVFLIAPIVGLVKSGGVANMEAAMQAAGASFTKPLSNGISAGMIGMMLAYFLSSPGDPTMPQRALAARNSEDAKTSFLVSGGIGYYMGIALIVIGCAVRVIIPGIENANQVLPTFILQCFPSAVRGLMIAGLLAAIMSSFDSFLILGTTHVMYDIGRTVKPDLSDEKIKKSLPIFTVLFGVLSIIVALYISSLFDFLYVVFSIMGAAVCPAMFSALLWREKTSAAGALASIIVGTVVPTYLYLTKGYDVWLGDPIFIGLIASIVALILFSIVIKDKKSVAEYEAEARADAAE